MLINPLNLLVGPEMKHSLSSVKGTQMSCVYVTHLKLTNSKFCAFGSRINHLEAYRMVSSRKIDSKVAIKLKHFDAKKCKMVNVMLEFYDPPLRNEF